MDKLSVNSSVKYSVIEELNDGFTLVKIRVMAAGKNRNMSYFDRDVIEAHLNSLGYVPVVAHLFKNEEGNYVIGGHDMYIDFEDWSIKSLCVPFGVVKPNTYAWETVNEYGIDVDYVTCEAILWTGRYPELKETIYSEDVYWNHSMEVDCKQYRPLEEDSNYVEILDFEWSALCLLYKSDNREENIEPCFMSAVVTPVFSADDFAEKMNEMKQAMSEVFAFENEEGENMDENQTSAVESENTEPETASNETTDNVIPVDFEALYNEALVTIGNLETRNAEFEAQIAELNAKVAALEPYKLAAEKAERDSAESEIFAKYDNRIGEMPEYKALKEKAGEYDLEQLDKECIMLVGKFAMSTFALNESKPSKAEPMKFSIETASAKVSPYGDIFERYGNNN